MAETPQLIKARLALAEFGAARDALEAELLAVAAREITRGEDYLADAAAGKPWQEAGAVESEGYVLGLLYALKRRRDTAGY